MLRLFGICCASVLLFVVGCGGETPDDNTCKTNTDCPNGQYCNSKGLCAVDCKTASDCLAGQKCTAFGKCIPKQPDSGPPKDSTPPKPDSKVVPDTSSTPDQSQPDLFAPDLPSPDLPLPDLPQPDLSKPDLLKPDLPKPDMPVTVPENTKARCQDKKDNDGDGFVDCKDQDCKIFAFCIPDVGIPDGPVTVLENTKVRCQDKKDNDGDGFVDCKDQDCKIFAFCIPDIGTVDKQFDKPVTASENTVSSCQDKKDNDGDGLVDCKDQDCKYFIFCLPDIGVPDQQILDMQVPDSQMPDMPVKNKCGGFNTLSPKPGSPCGTCGILICNGVNATMCSEKPEMVKIGTYCIDPYEASAWSKLGCAGTQYGVGKDDFPAGFSDVVESNKISGKNYKPQTTPVYACSKKGIVPSGNLTYYQAKRACENAGKRICLDSELVGACRGPHYGMYPYGSTYQTGYCNDKAAALNKPVATAQMKKCVGGYPGIYDLSGNLYETAMHSSGHALCVWRGGSYVHSYHYSGCHGATYGCTPWKSGPHLGFRCCLNSISSPKTDGAVPPDSGVADISTPDKALKNSCGGYSSLPVKPGTACGSCGVVVCNGLNATKCSHGPEMVDLGKYCIDAYEGSAWSKPGCAGVQYGVGKDDYPVGFSDVVESKSISGKNYKPQTTPVYACSMKSVLPSANLSYYQAKRACENVGKRICKDAELVVACQGPKNQKYPYGNTYKSGWCNDNSTLQKKPVKTSQMQKCVGGYPGIYDLSGNVYETAMGASGVATCNWRGGSYSHPYQYSGCSGATFGCTPWKSGPSVGFRCCRDSSQGTPTDGSVPLDQYIPPKDVGVSDAAVPQDSSTSACGSITSYGTCKGTIATFCDTQSTPNKIVSIDCAKQNALCGIVDPLVGIGCIVKNPCGKETPEGRCSGNTLIYCDEGKVKSISCGTLKCDPTGGVKGDADCVAKCSPGSWCVGQYYVATCSGTGKVTYKNCIANSELCQTSASGASCVAVTKGSRTVSGTVMFPSRVLSKSGYGKLQYYLAKNVIIGILNYSTNDWYVLAYTDSLGKFTIKLPSGVPNTFVLYIMPWRMDVDGSVYQVVDLKDNLYAPFVIYSMKSTHDIVNIKILEPDGSAFSIFDVFNSTLSYAKSMSGLFNRSVTIAWEKGSDYSGCQSCFSSKDTHNGQSVSRIYLAGGPSDSDHYDDPVIAHEVGHMVTWRYSKDDSPGGNHSLGVPAKPQLAWSEGIATAFGQTWAKSPLYLDGHAGGVTWTNYEKVTTVYPGAPKWPNPFDKVTQPLDEMIVGAALWATIHTNSNVAGSLGLGFPKIWKVITTYLPKYDRPTTGVDFVDFLDGMLCKNVASVKDVSLLYVSSFKFPYDFSGPYYCP